MADEWPSQKFRQSIISKINHALQSTGQDPSKNAGVMESHIFKKSRTKEEYMGLVAKLFMHFQDIAQRKPAQPPPPNTEMNQQSMMPDPLNALQTLASQGNRNAQMSGGPNPNQMSGPGGPVAASNLLQTLNQQRPGQQMQQLQGIRGQMPMGPGGPGGQMMPQMGGNMGGGMQMNVMGGGAGGAGGSAGGPQPQMVGNAQQMSGMQGPMNQMSSGGPGGPGGVSGPGGPAGAPNQMQMAGGQMQGGPINVNAMNVQQMGPQMQQMGQNQMAMGMNHQQINQMMNARLNAGGMGPNAGPQGMQGMPPNMQQGQSGPMHPGNVVGGPQGQQGGGMPPNAGQPGGMNPMMAMGPNMQQKGNMPMGQGGQMFPVNRGVPGQQQFLRQSPSPSTVPSPAGMGAAQQQMQQQQAGPNQQQQQQQLPNSQMIPSPALVPTSSPQMSNIMQNSQRNMRQSPSASLNTPGQVASNSPFNPQEDHLYREKYKQLTKYIDPLKRMVAKIGTDGANTEKFTKMSKLLEILSNPSQRVPLETLLKCEKALEKLDIVNFPSQQFGKSSNPLMEVINTTLQSNVANHTLHRTFRPSLELLFGTDICAPAPPKIQRTAPEKSTQFEHEIPHVLQGEIARLDQKFKVTLDVAAQNNTKAIKLLCCLDDKRLPSVPPVSVNIPEDYPFASPVCSLAEHEYLATPFLKAVQDALLSRIAKLPKCYSLSHLLDTWEMAVRQACSPSTKNALDLAAVFGA